MALGLTLAACKKDEEPAYPGPLAWGAPPPAAAPSPEVTRAPATPPPATARAGLPAAAGFPCASDADPLCPFGRCLGGRCGGCSDASACKPGAQCLPTWFGNACLPGASIHGSPQAQTPSPQATVAPTPSLPAAVPVGASTDPLAPIRARCVQRINEYRARVGVPALVRRTDQEACADEQALSDASSRRAHGAFGRCRESSQNECPGWPDALEVVVDRCLAMMFAEGPGSGPEHGHYTNMTDRNVRSVSCGIARDANGEVWMVQDFFR